jgi:hypothetical protein
LKNIRIRFLGPARRLGLTVDQYLGKVAAGFKWCSGAGKHWVRNEDFPRNKTTVDGLAHACRACQRSYFRNSGKSREDIMAEAAASLGGAK